MDELNGVTVSNTGEINFEIPTEQAKALGLAGDQPPVENQKTENVVSAQKVEPPPVAETKPADQTQPETAKAPEVKQEIKPPEKTFYTPEEMRSLDWEQLDTSRILPEMIPVYKSMQAAMTKSTQKLADEKRNYEQAKIDYLVQREAERAEFERQRQIAEVQQREKAYLETLDEDQKIKYEQNKQLQMILQQQDAKLREIEMRQQQIERDRANAMVMDEYADTIDRLKIADTPEIRSQIFNATAVRRAEDIQSRRQFTPMYEIAKQIVSDRGFTNPESFETFVRTNPNYSALEQKIISDYVAKKQSAGSTTIQSSPGQPTQVTNAQQATAKPKSFSELLEGYHNDPNVMNIAKQMEEALREEQRIL